MIIRTLTLTLDEVIEMTVNKKWKFFEVVGDQLRLEIPRGASEVWRVELNLKVETTATLLAAGFIEQALTREY